MSKAESQLKLKEDHNRLHNLINGLNEIQQPGKKIIINDRENVYAVEISSIYYLEADGPYTKIIKEDASLYISKNLKYFENILSDAGFFRTHHSYLANLNLMLRYDKTTSQLELKNGITIPVSIRKKDKLLTLIRSTSKN